MAVPPARDPMSPPTSVRRLAGGGEESLPAEPARDSTGSSWEVTIVAQDIGAVRGMERQLSDLICGLAQSGHQVTVIARTCELPATPGVTVRRVRGPSRPFVVAYPWFVFVASLAVRRWRRGIVQVTGALVLNRVDVIAVHYCHQVALPTPSKRTWLFRAHIKLVAPLKRIGERICFHRNRSATFVCVSEGVAEEIHEHYPTLSERTLTIHNGVDTEIFAPGHRREEARAMRSRLKVRDEALVAVFVGSEWERKGLGTVLQALGLAPEWELVVAGGGDESGYQALADEIGVGEAVHWMGVVSDVQIVFQMADAMVLPSSYETFSLVTFEAAASGLAVLATPVNGVRELIVNGQNGFLITQDPEAIAVRLRTLAADPALRARLGRAARLSALTFSSAEMVRKHEELYLRLTQERLSASRSSMNAVIRRR
jgi:glycosyltransferase involved in cell wall biosynthesis